MRNALFRSCAHLVQPSFSNQIERLLAAGFPRQLLVSLAEVLLTEVQGRRTREEREPNRNVAVIPCVSHRVKKAAGRAGGVRVVFSAPFKLGGMCRHVNKREGSRASSSKWHAKPFTERATWVVYVTPCSCGSVYVGQTGSYIYVTLKFAYSLSEYADDVNGSLFG
ncbi:hypothetical protein HPB52_006203 [Rhipicephalus sanguineus]|uniref:Tick transposon n=1 Tax=Rhipicephalus sanguineus TaxID=34632 RepID=A0A9D4PLK3_RHISA|nr:hypothetical protein HPB52_006203 [Rhipicephalus sanguineus]